MCVIKSLSPQECEWYSPMEHYEVFLIFMTSQIRSQIRQFSSNELLRLGLNNITISQYHLIQKC
jgi:hypothetical protein